MMNTTWKRDVSMMNIMTRGVNMNTSGMADYTPYGIIVSLLILFHEPWPGIEPRYPCMQAVYALHQSQLPLPLYPSIESIILHA